MTPSARSRGLVSAACIVLAGACTSRSEPTPSVEESIVLEPPVAQPGAPTIPSDAQPSAPPRECGACNSRTIVPGANARRLAVDTTDVFWIEDKTLVAAPRAGGDRRDLVTGVRDGSIALSADAAFVCRDRDDIDVDVLRVPKGGGEAVVVASAAGCQLAVAGEHLYFPMREPPVKARLARVPIAGGVQPLGPVTREIGDIRSDGTHVYWHQDDSILRVAIAGDVVVERVVEDAPGLERFVVTQSDVVWAQGPDVMRRAKSGATAAVTIANHQRLREMATDGARVYWVSPSEGSWTRWVPAAPDLEVFEVPGSTWTFAVAGTEVVFTVSEGSPRIDALDVCACGADVLVPRPAIREARPPEHEQEIRLGFADRGRVRVQIHDLSRDESDGIAQLDAEGRVIANDDPRLPARLRDGKPFRLTVPSGAFTGTIVEHGVGIGGSGTVYDVTIAAENVPDGHVWVTRPEGPVVARVRDTESDRDAVRLVLPAVRRAADGGGRRIGTKHVVAVRGAFPPPHAMIVAVEIEVPAKAGDEDATPMYTSALLLADAAGNITAEIFELEDRMDHFGIDQLVDIGDDGIDEVLFSSSYYEGQFQHVLRWNGDTPVHAFIAGDGA